MHKTLFTNFNANNNAGVITIFHFSQALMDKDVPVPSIGLTIEKGHNGKNILSFY